jgi:sulfur-oxidizing protein SoxX
LIAAVLCCINLAARGGEAEAVRKLLTDPGKGNCIICHFIPLPGISADAAGNLGPSLAHVGSRMTSGQIKARIVDPRPSSPDTAMPAYGSTTALFRVQGAYAGKPILTEAEIDAVTAYLETLK